MYWIIWIFLIMVIVCLEVSGACPKDPKNVIIFIDTCRTYEASYISDIGDGPCEHSYHAHDIIKTYKRAGGKKKVWLITASRKPLPINPFIYALDRALKCNIDVISTSMISNEKDMYNPYEQYLINKFVKRGGRYYASAGNYSKNLAIYPVYPAAYDNVIAVGAKDCMDEDPTNYPIAKYSNRGYKVKYWHCGQNSFNKYSQGTSLATPRVVAEKEK